MAKGSVYNDHDKVPNREYRVRAVLARLRGGKNIRKQSSIFSWGRMTITIKDDYGQVMELWKPKRYDIIAVFAYIHINWRMLFKTEAENGYSFCYEDISQLSRGIMKNTVLTSDTFIDVQREIDTHWGVHKHCLCPVLRNASMFSDYFNPPATNVIRGSSHVVTYKMPPQVTAAASKPVTVTEPTAPVTASQPTSWPTLIWPSSATPYHPPVIPDATSPLVFAYHPMVGTPYPEQQQKQQQHYQHYQQQQHQQQLKKPLYFNPAIPSRHNRYHPYFLPYNATSAVQQQDCSFDSNTMYSMNAPRHARTSLLGATTASPSPPQPRPVSDSTSSINGSSSESTVASASALVLLSFAEAARVTGACSSGVSSSSPSVQVNPSAGKCFAAMS